MLPALRQGGEGLRAACLAGLHESQVRQVEAFVEDIEAQLPELEAWALRLRAEAGPGSTREEHLVQRIAILLHGSRTQYMDCSGHKVATAQHALGGAPYIGGAPKDHIEKWSSAPKEAQLLECIAEGIFDLDSVQVEWTRGTSERETAATRGARARPDGGPVDRQQLANKVPQRECQVGATDGWTTQRCAASAIAVVDDRPQPQPKLQLPLAREVPAVRPPKTQEQPPGQQSADSPASPASTSDAVHGGGLEDLLLLVNTNFEFVRAVSDQTTARCAVTALKVKKVRGDVRSQSRQGELQRDLTAARPGGGAGLTLAALAAEKRPACSPQGRTRSIGPLAQTLAQPYGPATPTRTGTAPLVIPARAEGRRRSDPGLPSPSSEQPAHMPLQGDRQYVMLDGTPAALSGALTRGPPKELATATPAVQPQTADSPPSTRADAEASAHPVPPSSARLPESRPRRAKAPFQSLDGDVSKSRPLCSIGAAVPAASAQTIPDGALSLATSLCARGEALRVGSGFRAVRDAAQCSQSAVAAG